MSKKENKKAQSTNDQKIEDQIEELVNEAQSESMKVEIESDDELKDSDETITDEVEEALEDSKKEKKGFFGRKNKSTDEVENLKQEIGESKDKYLRLFAEFDNFKKRNARERLELIETAGKEVMISILPVLDDFERALNHIEDDKEAEELRKGVLLIYQKLLTSLEQKGLKEMESKGKDFDPDFHQAITEIEAPSKKLKGKVVDVIEKGYFIGDKILRHAKVVVGK